MRETSRRQLLVGLGAGAVTLPAIGLGADRAPITRSPSPLQPDGRLTVNRERAYRLMEEAGLDAIVGASELNSQYLTNMRSIFADMGQPRTLIGVLPADPSKPLIAIVAAGFDIARHTQADREWPEIVTYTRPAQLEAFADGAAIDLETAVEALEMPRRGTDGDTGLTDKERRWLAAANGRPTFNEATAELALRRVLRELGLQRGRIGVDDPAVSHALVSYGWASDTLVDATNLFQKLRMVKSPVEIERMRTTAVLNADAARAMFETLQPGMTYQDVEASFFAEVARRGGRPAMVAAGMVSGLRQGILVKHEPMLFDCVGRFNGYCGDFGRTVVLGTPSNKIEQRMQVLRKLVPATFELIRPGVSYSELRRKAAEIVHKMGVDFRVGVGPHSVGMQHTDDAARDDLPFRVRADTVLEAGMTITLDMPTLEPGWGSTHMESLILVREDGAEWLDPYDDPLHEVPA
ncbi:MAG: M24 family metallopeptidase [Gammaproteobacteria bacterium]|nr:M24 family metallopeptidase [Gammaproteobacteria bacterium]TVS11619.1 MAG: M24 family metallopeptidase [Gammaproteobacteria bacterium]